MSRLTLTKKAADSLRKSVANVRKEYTRASIDVCKVLWETCNATVMENGEPRAVWDLWGYPSWAAYVEEEAGFSSSTAHNYARVWEVFFLDLRGSWDETNVLPITKMIILSQAALTRNNVNAWMERVSNTNMTCAALKLAVQGRLNGRSTDIKTFTTVLPARKMKKFLGILDEARQVYGDPTLSRNDAMFRIAQDWRQVMTANTIDADAAE